GRGIPSRSYVVISLLPADKYPTGTVTEQGCFSTGNPRPHMVRTQSNQLLCYETATKSVRLQTALEAREGTGMPQVVTAQRALVAAPFLWSRGRRSGAG